MDDPNRETRFKSGICNSACFLGQRPTKGIRREDKSRERNGCENPIKIKSRRRRRVMAGQMLCTNSSLPIHHNNKSPLLSLHEIAENVVRYPCRRAGGKLSVQCSENQTQILRTCKHCKSQFDPLQNHPRACRFHSAHFGGETKRKFESVYTGGTMHTPDSGKVYQYWHCCGSEDPFDPGCTAAPHSSYDD